MRKIHFLNPGRFLLYVEISTEELKSGLQRRSSLVSSSTRGAQSSGVHLGAYLSILFECLLRHMELIQGNEVGLE